MPISSASFDVCVIGAGAAGMLCDIAARLDESYIPRWMGIVTPILMSDNRIAEFLTDLNYVEQVGRYEKRIEESRALVEKWREA